MDNIFYDNDPCIPLVLTQHILLLLLKYTLTNQNSLTKMMIYFFIIEQIKKTYLKLYMENILR